MTLKIEIDMDNAAFVDDGPGVEASRIIRVLADRLLYNLDELNDYKYPLFDVNGNRVGFATIEE